MNALGPLAEDATHLLPLIVLMSIRIGVAFAALPAPFGTGAPMAMRAALGVMIAAVLALPHPERADALVLDAFFLGFCALEEALVGAAIGLLGRSIIASAEVAGDIAASSMGLSFAQTVDPTSGEQTPITSHALGLLAMVVLVGLDGHHVIVQGLARSFELAPVGDALGGMAGEGIFRSVAVLFGAGLRIASPVVGVLFFVQLALGLIARAAPKLQVFGLSFAVAVGVGLLTLHAAMPTTLSAMAADVRALPEAIDGIFAR